MLYCLYRLYTNLGLYYCIIFVFSDHMVQLSDEDEESFGSKKVEHRKVTEVTSLASCNM